MSDPSSGGSLRALLRLILRIFFRSVEVVGAERSLARMRDVARTSGAHPSA